jgi:hypothetical protein
MLSDVSDSRPLTMKDNPMDLKIGDSIKIGQASSKKCGLEAGSTITLIEGFFECENGLYTETHTAPAIWNEENKEFDSIYHLFGNKLEDFLDSEKVT